MESVYSEFKNVIHNNSLIRKDDTVIVALSGGKDSVALTILLKQLQNKFDFNLIAAYFNHKIRTDHREEETWVRNFSKDNKLKLYTSSASVKSYVKQNKINLENGASILRYDFFHSLLKKNKNSKIFTAHTKSDTTETFFIKLFRGSGLQGLTSISMIKNGQIFRPLLNFTKMEILNFLEINKIQFYTDSSNSDNKFLRNRIRNNLIPQIMEIEPNIDNSIYKTIEIIKDEYDYFSRSAKTILEKNIILNKILPCSTVSGLHLALKRHLLREYIRHVKGNLLNISFENLQSLLAAITTNTNISLPALDLIIKNNFIFPSDLRIKPYNYLIYENDKKTKIKEIGKNISIKKKNKFLKPDNNNEIIIPKDKLNFPLAIRNPNKNDRYKKINSTINMTVFEMIRSLNIPLELRNQHPVLINSSGEIIWVFGAPVSDAFKILKKNDKNILIQIKIV